MTLGNRILELRARSGLLQEDFEELFDIPTRPSHAGNSISPSRRYRKLYRWRTPLA